MLRLSLAAGLLVALCLEVRGDSLDDYVRSRVEPLHLTGVSIAVVKDGVVVKTAGYGLANVESGVPATADTVYRIASLTKPFTAEAILLLAGEKKIELDAPIARYLERTPANWESITVRQLLAHTSGIKDYLNGMQSQTCNGTTPEEIVAALGKLPLDFAPNTRLAYSNSGYLVLGMIVERVTGKRYDRFMKERIFQPLAMTATRRDDPYALIPRRSAGYVWVDGQLRNSKPPEPTLVDNADAGVVSTAADLARWAVALDRHRLLDAAGYAAMETPVRLQDGSVQPWGLGWNIDNIDGHARIWRDGNRADGSAFMGRYPDQKLTVIVLSNTSDAHPGTLAGEIAARLAPELAAHEKGIEDGAPAVTARLRAVLLRFQDGTIDPAPFTDDWKEQLPGVSGYLRNQFAAGPLRSLSLLSRSTAHLLPAYRYEAVFGSTTFTIDLTLAADGRIHEMSVGTR
jgi:D-alanyl-D-alanine carboxypeptidase